MQENDYLLLLQKKFTGQITAGELELLEAWIGQSPRHAEWAEQHTRIWNSATLPEKQFSLDLDEEFGALQRRIAREQAPAAKTVSIGYRWVRIAAGLVLLLTAVWGYRRFAAPADSEMILVQAGAREKQQVNLPDGTQVWLRKNSTLEYPATLANSAQRRVKLNGEAYFEVSHHADRPFRVEMPGNSHVEVLGTEFDVKAYPGTLESMVLVRNGKVRFAPAGMKNGPVLAAGEKAVFVHASAQVIRSRVSSFNELAWQFGGLQFVRTPLHEVVSHLESYYGVHIEIRNTSLLNCTYTAPLTDQPVEQVLDAVSTAYQASLSNPAPGLFVLSGGIGCR